MRRIDGCTIFAAWNRDAGCLLRLMISMALLVRENLSGTLFEANLPGTIDSIWQNSQTGYFDTQSQTSYFLFGSKQLISTMYELRALDTNGTILSKYSHPSKNATSIQSSTSARYTLFSQNDQIRTVTVALSAGPTPTLTFTDVASLSYYNKHQLGISHGISEPTTNYAYFVGLPQLLVAQSVLKFDIANLQGTFGILHWRSVVAYFASNALQSLVWYSNDYFMVIGVQEAFIMDRNLLQIRRFTDSQIGYNAVGTSLYTDTYLFSSVDSTLQLAMITPATLPVFLSIEKITTVAPSYNTLFVSTFTLWLYILLPPYRTVYFADGNTLQTVYTYLLNNPAASQTITSGMETFTSFQFALVNSDDNNILSHTFYQDNCLIVGQNPCAACEAGYNLIVQQPGVTTCQKSLMVGWVPPPIIPTICLGDATLGCLACPVNIKNCTECDNPNGYFLYFNKTTELFTCYKTGSFPVGLGINNQHNIIEECLAASCSNCKDDYMACTGCAQGLLLYELLCLDPNISIVNSPTLDPETSQFEIQFNQNLLKADVSPLIDFTVLLTDGRQLDRMNYATALYLTRPNVLEGTVIMKTYTATWDYVAFIYLSHKSQTKLAILNSESYFPPNQVIKIGIKASKKKPCGDSCGSTYTKVSMGSVFVGSVIASNTAGAGSSRISSLIKIIDSVEYALYLNGVRVKRGDQFLHKFSSNFLSILPNYLGMREDYESCKLIINFAREGLGCSFINNYGSELLSIIILVISIFIVERLNQLSSWLNDRYKQNRATRAYGALVSLLGSIFNRKTLFCFFEGSQIEIFRIALINFVTINNSAVSMVGFCVAVSIMALYSVMLYYCIKHANELRKEILNISVSRTKLSKSTIYPSSKRFLTLRNTLTSVSQNNTLKIVPTENTLSIQVTSAYSKLARTAKTSPYVESLFVGMKECKPKQLNLHVYLPSLAIVRGVLTQASLVIFAGDSPLQLWFIAGVDAAFFLFATLLRPYPQLFCSIVLTVGAFGLTTLDFLFLFLNFY